VPDIGLRPLGGDDRLRALIVTGHTDIHHDWRTVSPMLAEMLRQWNALPGMGEEHPLVWTNRYGQGRVFATGIGHGPEAIAHPSFRGLFTRGAEWAATGKVSLALPEEFGEPVPGGDWWPTTLEPMVRSMYDQRKQGAAQ
jgi:hypothetical protein